MEKEQFAENKAKVIKTACEIYGVSIDEFKEAVDELSKNGIAKGCYQNTNALIAVLAIIA